MTETPGEAFKKQLEQRLASNPDGSRSSTKFSLTDSQRSTSALSESSRTGSILETPDTRERRARTIWEGASEEEWKICTVGSQCGKSALVVRFVYDKFSDVDEPTVEDNHKKEGSTFYVEGIKTTLKILDTSGSDDYASFREDWFSRSEGFVFVYSIASLSTFELLPTFFDQITQVKKTDKFPMVLVGTCADAKKRAVTQKQGRDLARKYNCPFIEVSAKTGENVEEVFKAIVDELRYGKKKDPFIQENPYYKASWEDLLQIPVNKDQVILKPDLPEYKSETGCSTAINFYEFPHNAESKDVASPTVATSVFGVTLEECMMKQKDRLPELEVPRIFLHLRDLFYELEGTTTEGVFRVPATLETVKKLREQLNSGNYRLMESKPSIHDIAALMKMWLRELKEPLVPIQHYDTCVTQPEKAAEIYKQLPPLNKRVVDYLVDFLCDLCRPEVVEKTKMTKENLSMVFAPSFLRCTYTDSGSMIAAADKEKGFVMKLFEIADKVDKSKSAIIPHTLLFEREEKYISYYNEYFFVEKDHVVFMGKDNSGSPLVAAVAMNPVRENWRTLVITKEQRYRYFIPASKDKKDIIMTNIKNGASSNGLTIAKMNKPKNQKKFSKEINTFEQREVANNYKWGVLYLKEGQDEDEMYANTSGSPDFEEFLSFLGEKVVLKDFQGFRGGLDIKKNSTGTHSVYTQFFDMEIMFHVATLLPSYPNDKQQLERKRHLGNDIVVIIFKEAKTPFDPKMLKSEFNHIFVVVSLVDKNHYHIAIVNKDGVPPYGPPIPHPGIFEKNDALRNFFFIKLINGERAALHGCPNFKNKMITVRRTNLEQLEKSYGKKK